MFCHAGKSLPAARTHASFRSTQRRICANSLSLVALASACRLPTAQIVFFYSVLFVVPSFMAFAFTGFKTQLSPEELLKSKAAQERLRGESMGKEDEEHKKEMRAAMNKVLFETKGSLGKPDWAIKRDERRAAEKAAREAAQQQNATA